MEYPYNDIFNFPDRILLNKRITKSFFTKNFDLTTTEKKLLNKNVQHIEWFASIKPSNANISEVKNEEYIFEEIQVIICTIPTNQLNVISNKCIDLLQKYIPYQLVVIVEDEYDFIVNTCDKRVNFNNTAKRVVTNCLMSTTISKLFKNDITSSFFKALDFSQLDKTNMQTTYDSYTQALVEFQTALITGKFKKRNHLRTEKDMIILVAIEEVEKEITGLKSKLKKEIQLNIKVELNIEIQKRRNKIKELKNKLSTDEH